MASYVKMPRLGLTMTEGVIIKWLKKEGDAVNKGDEIVEIESDKSVVSHESAESGILLKILAEEGQSSKIYSPIAIIGEQGEVLEDIPDLTEGKDPEGEREPAKIPEAEEGITDRHSRKEDRIFISPAAKRVAKENNIEIGDIPFPSGKKRIEKSDVMTFIIKQNQKVKVTPLASKIAEENGIDLTSLDKKPGERIYSSDLPVSQTVQKTSSRISVTGMRKVIAAKMKSSLDTAAHVSLTTEVDMHNVVDLKNRIKDKIMQKFGVNPSINDIVIKCVAIALKDHPRMNSVFSNTEIIEQAEINIGMAVALPEGLVVPVIRNADSLSIGEISAASRKLSEKAKQGKLLPDEYSGGTFTVSNLGMFEITQFTSIINQPESAILSVAKIVKRPVVENDQIHIKPMMNLTINFDHRPIDGAMAANFLKRVKQLLEEPYELIM